MLQYVILNDHDKGEPMAKQVIFEYPICGSGRPQILLIGNGLEYKSGQVSWNELVKHLTVEDCVSLSEDEKKTIPFPLLYETIVLHEPVPPVLGKDDIKEIEQRLKKEMLGLKNESNDLLDRLPELGADHIFTTNYSYCLEKAFFPKKDFKKSGTRTDERFNLLPTNENGKQPNEKYRLHSGYLASKNDRMTALWHIHGECHAPSGIVIGHDRYGRLLNRIIDSCSKLNYKSITKQNSPHLFKSWPELFLFGDVYVIGFGYAHCEFDLWWLLRRKQRERHGDGRVYFYDKAIDMTTNSREAQDKSLRDKLLEAHGVKIIDCGLTTSASYDEFYGKVFEDVREKMKLARL